MQYPDDNLIDIMAELQKVIRRMSDAEWEGKTEEAEFCQKLINYYSKLLKKGHVYAPRF
tara:strand:- start:254 stop:430 length:177 start_codon:yes stop_codon:yes gene_type:complete